MGEHTRRAIDGAAPPFEGQLPASTTHSKQRPRPPALVAEMLAQAAARHDATRARMPVREQAHPPSHARRLPLGSRAAHAVARACCHRPQAPARWLERSRKLRPDLLRRARERWLMGKHNHRAATLPRAQQSRRKRESRMRRARNTVAQRAPAVPPFPHAFRIRKLWAGKGARAIRHSGSRCSDDRFGTNPAASRLL